ncbi:MAG: enoyl-CoA hydratase/isomerase family protein [Desulfarculus sp.]|nr:enoyl-CoA hydratase/isomerase family protein [Pseudomonadota bacterium]MBU4575039.1 enoyl-CoA hydratase/isomerase family protein [Pseudomonadota bacterium]MBU4598748.1 enoyl-CoA hydratase/isomerase family protein [Pseudomonadota bacterium]MBV1717451.1 enoyl-CoA hydratase/isomerase family protein [Desulfarculus sp.]MBV1740021.1 enoyl-CoA hydratase/isomerase family protein [Desulfarculus sp.]
MSKVLYDKDGPIARITLNRPEAMNAIDFEMIQLLHDIWEDFKGDDELRVALLKSSSENFCVGFDIASIAAKLGQDKYSWDKSSMFGEVNINPIEHGVQKPIISAIAGNVNGAGLWLVLASDIRLATPKSAFGLGEVRINFPVEFTGLLSRYMPTSLASEMLYTARPVGAKRLYDLGILNAVVEAEGLQQAAEAYAKDICAGGPLAVRAMKALLQKGPDLDYQATLKLSDSLITPVVNSLDTMEGIQAFAQKRRPAWQGK